MKRCYRGKIHNPNKNLNCYLDKANENCFRNILHAKILYTLCTFVFNNGV
jgi:hypothetical protein